MKKRVLSLTALVLIGLSSTFGATFSAEAVVTNEKANLESVTEVSSESSDSHKQVRGTTYAGGTTKEYNDHCSKTSEEKQYKSVNKGDMYYGCTTSGRDSVYTEYSNPYSTDYSSFTYLNSNKYDYGDKVDDGATSYHSYVNVEAGTFYNKVLFYD